MKKSLKKVAAAIMAGMIFLCLAACSSNTIEALDFAEQFNKASKNYQIDAARFTRSELSDGSRRTYVFSSSDTNIGSFTLIAYLTDKNDSVERLTLTLPVGMDALAGILQGGNTTKEPIPAERKSAFKELFIALTRAYTGASESEAADCFTELGLDDDAAYSNNGSREKAYDQYTFAFTVTPITTTLQISNNQLYVSETNGTSQAATK